MPRYPIREARELLDKVLVAPQAAPVAGDRPGARGQSSQSAGRRAGAGSRRGTAAQGEQNPGAMAGPRRRAQDLLKRVQNHRIDLADPRARRAELRRGWTIRRARCAG
jgi:hypothetical protein